MNCTRIFFSWKKCRIESIFKRAEILLLPFDICAGIWHSCSFVFWGGFVCFVLSEFYSCSLAKDQSLPFSGIPALVFYHLEFSKNCLNEFVNPLNSEVNSMEHADLIDTTLGFTGTGGFTLLIVLLPWLTLPYNCLGPEFSFLILILSWENKVPKIINHLYGKIYS